MKLTDFEYRVISCPYPVGSVYGMAFEGFSSIVRYRVMSVKFESSSSRLVARYEIDDGRGKHEMTGERLGELIRRSCVAFGEPNYTHTNGYTSESEPNGAGSGVEYMSTPEALDLTERLRSYQKSRGMGVEE